MWGANVGRPLTSHHSNPHLFPLPSPFPPSLSPSSLPSTTTFIKSLPNVELDGRAEDPHEEVVEGDVLGELYHEHVRPVRGHHHGHHQNRRRDAESEGKIEVTLQAL